MAQNYSVNIVTKVSGYQQVQKLEQALKGVTASQNKVDSAARKAAGGVSALGTASRNAGTSAKASAAGFKTMGAAISAATIKITAVITAVQTFSRVLGTAFERQNAEKRLQNLTGSTEEYEAALLAAASVSEKFGMTQTEATKAMGDAYGRIGSLGYGLKEVTQLYTGFNTVAREAGVSSEDAAGAFLQLSQGMGAGVLNGENLMTIMERMPQVGALLAQELNVSAGQIRQMGADGKITSEVMFNALSKAAEGAGDLSDKLTPAQKSMNEFNKAIDEISVALGSALIPALTELATALIPTIKGAAGVITMLTKAVSGLINKLNELGAGKVFDFLMAPARAFEKLMGGAADNTEDLVKNAKEAVEPFSSIPAPAGQAAEAAKDIKDNMEGAATATGTAKTQADGLAVSLGNAAQQSSTIEPPMAAAAGSAATMADGVKDAVKPAQDVAKAAEVTQKANGESLKFHPPVTREMRIQKALQMDMGERVEKMLEDKLELYDTDEKTRNVIREQHALLNQNKLAYQEAAYEAGYNREIQNEISGILDQNNTKIEQMVSGLWNGADAANALAGNLASAGSAAGGGGGGGKRLGSSFTVWHGDQVYDKYKLDENGNIVETTDEERKRQMNAAKIGRANAMANEEQVRDFLDTFNWQKYIENGGWKMNPVGGMAASAATSKGGIGFQAFAEGGYVTQATNAIIGEGGEPEYVIPESKMSGAMSRYSSGVRGDGVVGGAVTANVNYSGTTLNFNGDEYVKKSDVGGIVKQATAATGNAMRNSSKYRLENGL